MIKLAALLDSETLRRLAAEALKEKRANGDMLQYFADHPEKLRAKKLRDAKKKTAAMEKWTERLKGGLADGKKPAQFDRRALSRGRKVEREHTKDDSLATEIAMDHLTEDPAYYEKLKLIEKKATLVAFDDEFEKISKSWLTNVGTKVGRWAGAQPAQLAGAVKDHFRPMKPIKEGWKRSSWFGLKGLTVAGAAASAADVAPKEDPMGMGRGRGERLGNALASTASGLVTMRRGAIPSIATSIGAGYAGGKVGKLFDKKKGKGKRAPQQDAPPPTTKALPEQQA